MSLAVTLDGKLVLLTHWADRAEIAVNLLLRDLTLETVG